MAELLVSDHDKRIYENAVLRARTRIEQDARRATAHVRRFLFHLASRFLDPDADVSTIIRDVRATRNTIHPHFHKHIGTTPWRYIRERRFDVAKQLLEQTHMPVWKVGTLVGYPQPRTFGRAFKMTAGHTPAQQRRLEES